MSDTADIPQDVLQFLAERIDTVPHLEALLLLWRSAGQRWTEEEIAARVYVNLETARHILQDLHRRGMISAEGSAASARYAYDPGWDQTQLMPDIAVTYARDLIRISRFIHSKASPGVREFARAFKLKKD